MSEEQQKTDEKTGCRNTECVLNWMKVVDDVSVAGLQNKLPRMYWVAAALVMLFLFL